jgi:hypothetical protein
MWELWWIDLKGDTFFFVHFGLLLPGIFFISVLFIRLIKQKIREYKRKKEGRDFEISMILLVKPLQ